MQKDPYLVLGLTNEATQDEINEAYQKLKAQYQEQLFEDGEVGNEAGRKLAELNAAYNQCIEDKANAVDVNTGSKNLSEIEDLIKNKKYEEAQTALDDIEMRDAQWHYLQAGIYHKRGWNVESKKQLEIAVTLDPDNAKYKTALDNMNKLLSQNPKANQNTNQQQQQARSGYSKPNEQQQQTGNSANACCDTCSTLLCCDCCCESMGGDLISCC